MHHRLGVDAGDRLLDVACGSGLAIELARLRGASCAGIDASPRLTAVARDRNPDPQLYARALAATGPAYEAIQNVGEAEFHRTAVELAEGQGRDGLPLRAEIKVVGYLARKPEAAERA
jgi:SAM-dependent methyltransferase